MSILKSKKFNIFLGFFVSLVMLVWLASAMDWKQVGVEILRVNYILFIPITVIFVVHVVVRSIRWKMFLPDSTPESKLIDRFDGLMLGALATFILPLRAGEFVRPFILWKKSSVPFAIGFASVVIERFFDLTAVLISFFVVANFVPGLPPEYKKGAIGLGILALGLLSVLIAGALAPKRLTRLVNVMTSRLPAKFGTLIQNFVADLLQGMVALRNPKRLLGVLFYTILIWATNYGVYYFFVALVNIEPTILFGTVLAVILALAVAAPSSPGFIGVYEGACVVAFSLFGFSKELATTCGIVSHAYQYVFFVAYGIVAMSRGKLTLKDLRQQEV